MIERIYHCDGPDCERTWKTQGHRELDMPVVSNAGPTLHFCGWDCVLRYAGSKEPEKLVRIDGDETNEAFGV